MGPSEGPVVYRRRLKPPGWRLFGLPLATYLLAAALIGSVSGSVAALGSAAPAKPRAIAAPSPTAAAWTPPERALEPAADGRVGLPPAPSSGRSTAEASAILEPRTAALGPKAAAPGRSARRSAEGPLEVAIVIDDLGLSPVRTDKVIALRGPLTLSFLPYGGLVRPLARQAKAAGHEVMLHLPMEPLGSEDPGPHALLVRHTTEQLLEQLSWALDRFDGYVGINNHMGSRLTEDAQAMRTVMAGLKGRGLFFLDSGTSQRSLAYDVALASQVPALKRDVFLDHAIEPGKIADQIALFEDVARRTGTAVAIAHPHDATIEALEAWLETAPARGFVLVPASRILALRAGRAGQIAVALPERDTSME